MRFREKSEMKNFSDFRGRPGQLPVRILKKELDIRHPERRVNHHARGQNENPKKIGGIFEIFYFTNPHMNLSI